MKWRKSSRSNATGGSCVELADAGRAVAVRDSKNPTGPRLMFGRRTAATFARGIKSGRYDQ